MIRYLLHGLAVHFRAGRMLFLLTLVGVALGVASILSIQIIHASATAAFAGSLRAVHGTSDLAVVGMDRAMPESMLGKVLADPSVAQALPLYQVPVALLGKEDFFLDLLGVDMMAASELPFADETQRIGEPLYTPGWSAVSPELASRFGWKLGETIPVGAGSKRVELFVGALIDFRQLVPLAGTRMVVMDIAQAQSLTGGAGILHRIDIVLREGIDPAIAQSALGRRLSAGVRVRTPAQRESEALGLMAAFRLNLTALSWISVVVGAFLVYASTRAALMRRRTEFGLLRAIGATRGQVVVQILAEVGLLGLLGVGAGLPLGIAVAQANLDRVSATLSNLYLLQEIERLRIDPGAVAIAIFAGLFGAVVGAIAPALEMSGRHPRSLLASYTVHRQASARSGFLLMSGLVIVSVAFALGGTVLADWRPAGFLMALSLLIAIPLISPSAVRLVSSAARTQRFGLRWGIRALGVKLQTTAVAVAALAVTVSMLMGITVMIGSFRTTVQIWIGSTLQSDIYVTTQSWRRARNAAQISPDIVDALRANPRVAQIFSLRQLQVYVGERRIVLSGTDMETTGTVGGMALLDGDVESARLALRTDGAVVITEPLARKAGLDVGDVLHVQHSQGESSFPIAAVAYDYSSEAGGAIVSLNTFRSIFGPGQPSNLAIVLKPGVEPEFEVGRLQAQFAGIPLEIRSNRTIREEVVRIFNQTFAVTRILQGISLLIAICGITLTLLVLARERVAELALYRSLGATRLQILRVFVGKGLGLGLTGLVLGAAGGAALAAILIFRINRDYFGWTIALHWPWHELAIQALTIVGAAVLASLYPAFRASRIPATELSRENL